MRRIVFVGVVGVALALPASAFTSRDDKGDIKNAAKKLGETSYTFSSSSKSEGGGGGGGGGRGMGGGPIEGKTDKDGYTQVTSSGQQGTSNEAIIKGDKVAVKTKDGWKGADEFQQGGGGGRQRDPAAGFARLAKNIKLPPTQADSLADKAKELKKNDDGSYSGDLSEDGAKELMTFGGRGGGQGPQITDPKGSVKFWIKDGVLVKYEYNVQGKMQGRNNQEININRTTTVEIKDIGSTKVDVPEEAKKKLE